MKISSECAPCVYLQLMRTLHHQNIADQRAIAAEVMTVLSNEWQYLGNPGLALNMMYKIANENTGANNAYAEDKRRANRLGEHYWQEHPLELGDIPNRILYAAAGNVIDAGLATPTDQILQQLHDAITEGMARDDSERFLEQVPAYGTILYLTDNAGEIIFDRELMRSLGHQGWRIHILVRHQPFLNDVTLDDIPSLHLEEVCDDILDLGHDFALWHPDFFDMLSLTHHYDGFIIKGIANLEVLSHRMLPSPALFVYRAKCPPSSRLAGVKWNENVAWLQE